MHLPGIPLTSSSIVQASCSGPGDCTAISESPAADPSRVFASTELRGHWQSPHVISDGLPYFTVNSISCASALNCAFTGSYQTRTALFGIIVSEVNGRWGRPLIITTAPDSTGQTSSPGQVIDCPSVGNCVAGGGSTTPWVIAETNGVWAPVVSLEPPSQETGPSVVEEVSCPSVGTCTFSGIDTGGSGVFVESLTNGQWSGPTQIANLITPINFQNNEPAAVNSISCVSATACVLGGDYPVDRSPSMTYFVEPYVATETNGVWGPAAAPPGMVAANFGGSGTTSHVRCWQPGVCTALGLYSDHGQMYTWSAQLRGGRWAVTYDTSAHAKGGIYGPANDAWCISAATCVLTATDSPPGSSETCVISNGVCPLFTGPVVTDASRNGPWQPAHGVYPYYSYTYSTVFVLTCAPSGNYCLAGGGTDTDYSGLNWRQRDFLVVYS